MRKKVPKHLSKPIHSSNFFRVAIILITGLLLNFAWFASPGVFSRFSYEVSAVGKASVSAASSTLESVSIIGNSIVLKKGQDVTGEPIIYFSVEGPAAQYIKSFNPVTLSEKSEYYDKYSKLYKIPIPVAVNFQQWLDLIGKKDAADDIKGTITVKYLNNFISYPLDITLHPSYLRKAAGMTRENDNVQPFEAQPKSGTGQAGGDELNREISGALKNVAKYIEWKPVDLPKQQATGVVQAPTIDLTQNQSMIMDVIVPGLKGWIDYLYICIKNLQNQITQKGDEINRLNMELKKQKQENAALQEGIKAMSTEMGKLHEELNSKNQTVAPQQPNEDTQGTTDSSTPGTGNNNHESTNNSAPPAVDSSAPVVSTPGTTESSTPGTANNSNQEGANSSTTQPTGGSPQEASNSGTQGTTSGASQGTANGDTSGVPGNSSQGASSSNEAGTTSDISNGIPGTVSQDTANGSVARAANSNASGTANSGIQETANNNASAPANNSIQGTGNAGQ